MNMPNSDDEADERVIELRLPSRLGYEKVAMDTASSLARRMAFDSARIEALGTAVSDAVTNAIEHGNQADSATKGMVMRNARAHQLVGHIAHRGRTSRRHG